MRRRTNFAEADRRPPAGLFAVQNLCSNGEKK
jgi:hypothetical protein